MKKSNIINRNVRVIDEVRNEAVRNTSESFSDDDQIFRNITADDNLLNLEIRNTHATNKLNARRSNRLIEIESSLSKIDREKDTATFAAIDEISIKKK